MQPSTIDSLERLLRDRRERIWQQVAGEEEQLTEISAERESEQEEQAQETRDARILERLDARGKRAIEAIDAALRRIAEDAYGTCVQCEQEIPVERLRAVPETEFCIDCAARAEKYVRKRGEEDFSPEARAAGEAERPADIDLLDDAQARALVVEQLERDPRIDADQLRVEVRSKAVTLSGTLASEEQRQLAVRSVADVLGFRDVTDRIAVDPVVTERGERLRDRTERLPDDVDVAREGEPVETEDPVRSDEEGTGYAPPDKPPREEQP